MKVSVELSTGKYPKLMQSNDGHIYLVRAKNYDGTSTGTTIVGPRNNPQAGVGDQLMDLNEGYLTLLPSGTKIIIEV